MHQTKRQQSEEHGKLWLVRRRGILLPDTQKATGVVIANMMPLNHVFKMYHLPISEPRV
jgi:hypothetical protein